ncbi:MAG TPA: cytochrome c, partial [Trueperaceae bacterium]|nr:cytochrome c [Trueperaceae bacterium]
MDIVAERGFDEVLANANTGSSPSNTNSNAEVSGEDVYNSNCASCHQATGAGIPGAFPPLAGNAINHAKNNRDYLPATVINGLTGQIDVNGQSFNGAMPAWKHLSDAEITAVINYVTSNWDDATGLEPYTTDEIAAARAKSLNNADILKLRSQDSSSSSATTDAAASTESTAISTTSDSATTTPTAADNNDASSTETSSADTASTTETTTALSTATDTAATSDTTTNTTADTTTAISTSSDTADTASSNA